MALLINYLSAQPAELSERRLMNPTGWYWLTGANPDQVKAKVSEGYRIIDLEIESASPLKLTVAMVKNSGVHRKTWWWYYGLKGDQVSSKISEKKGRLIDIETYQVSGQKRYALLMVSNSGQNQKAWWYYTWKGFGDIKTQISQRKARLVDLDTYAKNGNRYYSAIMLPNKGKDAKSWWYYTNLSAAEIKQKLKQHSARLTDIEVRSAGSSGTKFAVLMEKNEGTTWWWYYGKTMKQLKEITAQKGARIFDIETYKVNGKKRFAVLMLRNTNDQTEAMRTYLGKKRKGGYYGFYLKEVKGEVKASLQSGKVFYPASTIKVLEHVHAMCAVQAGSVKLTDRVTKYENVAQSCSDNHRGHSASSASLEVILRTMMKNSDNQSTNALQEYFGNGNAENGRNAMNNTARNVLGMSSRTKLHHKFECGGPRNEDPNSLTLKDLGKLYEKVSGGLLTGSNKTKFDDLMQNFNDINSIIDEEAAKLGISSAKKQAFKSKVKSMAKAGSIKSGGKYYRSIGGWVSLPLRSGKSRSYVFGIFIDQADELEAGFKTWDAAAKLLRKQVNEALGTMKEVGP